jgi:hypothetical protein
MTPATAPIAPSQLTLPDAINTSLEVILACHALNLNRSWWTSQA